MLVSIWLGTNKEAGNQQIVRVLQQKGEFISWGTHNHEISNFSKSKTIQIEKSTKISRCLTYMTALSAAMSMLQL